MSIFGLILSRSVCSLKSKLFMKKGSVDNSLSRFQETSFYKPKTVNQELYQKMLEHPNVNILFAVGPAGTGKTMLACNNAIKALKAGKIEKIVLTRPVVPVEEEDIGFLPGSVNKKMNPWIRPIIDVFSEYYSQREIDTMMQNNMIEISPLAFMRGRTFKKSMIIADEMQNSSPNQMLMLITRIGKDSKMVITGDLNQSDKPGVTSGLYDFIQKYRMYKSVTNVATTNITNNIELVELNATDIERHPVISTILEIYNTKTLITSNQYSNKDTTNDCAIIPKHHITRDIKP
jgi:phosphate starvation-inducible PhoH-like protein